MGSQNAPTERLVWVDIETTGLTSSLPKATILELGIIITDWNLNEIARFRQVIGAGWTLERADNEMPAIVRNMHLNSGLLYELESDDTTMLEAEDQAGLWLKEQLNIDLINDSGVLGPMCGSSIHTDRQFLAQWMPSLHRLFHYRNIDTSTLTELCKRWNPEVAKGLTFKRDEHTTLSDLEDSIAATAFLMDNFMFVTLPVPITD